MHDSLIIGVRPEPGYRDHHRGRGNRHLHRGPAARAAVHPGRPRPPADRRPGPGHALEEQRNGEWRYLEFLQVTS
jgi:hypothetical protein